MSTTIGNSKNLDTGRAEALQGLLSSLGHRTGDNPSQDTPLSTEQLQELSKKIDEILGDGADRDPAPGDQPNQLLNEDGLPIIDISEPADENSQTSPSPPPVLEQDLIPLSLLSPDERERRQRERDRILDLLEEEELLQKLREERDAEEERKEAIRKRKESAKAELEQLKATRDLQRKMGQALVRQAKAVGEKRQEEDLRLQPQITSPAKKSVSFADALVVEASKREEQTETHQPDWGDVAPGRLRARSRIPLMSTIQAQESPMKTHVVERCPTGTPTSPSREADSDDESTSAGHLSPHAENNSEEDGSSSSDSGLTDGEPLEEGFDYDTAQHHREIALEYHNKRHAIGVETAKAMATRTPDDPEQHETVSHRSLHAPAKVKNDSSSQSNEQLLMSRFRADRMATAYDKSHGPVSTSIGQSVVPASRQRPLRNSVRLGKLENGQLVGGESGESGSEDEIVREMIEMLQTGDIRNAGPNFKPSSTSIIAPPRISDALEMPSTEASSVSHRAKPSRFKLARGRRNTESTTSQRNNKGDIAWPQPAMSSVLERKAPESVPDQTLNKPRPPSGTKISESAAHMIIDSPSFPMTVTTPPVIALPSSPSNFMAMSSSLTNQTRPERPSSVRPSATHGSMLQSQVSPREPSPVGSPVSTFVVERKK